jgi:hypothetical protein
MLRAILESKELFAFRPQAEMLLTKLSKQTSPTDSNAPKSPPAATANP